MAAARFVAGASLSATAGALLLALWTVRNAPGSMAWAAAGFAAMAIPAVGFGGWLARELGRPGPRFLTALVGGIASRLVFAAAAAFRAARAGGDARFAVLAGIVCGFVPVLVFELFWLARTSAAHARQAETRG